MTSPARFLRDDGYIIFLFHGVIRRPRPRLRNYSGKHMALDRFVTVIRELVRWGVPVSLPEIVAAHRTRTALPPRAFAITFDDGFANNYTEASLILEGFKIPATFYVTSSFVENNGASWIDLVEYALERAERGRLDFPEIELHEAFSDTWGEKTVLLNKIRLLVKSTPEIDPYAFAQEVWKQVGIISWEPDLQLDQKMTWEQVKDLSRYDRFTIGGHGHTHRILEYLDDAELEAEVSMSLELLERELEMPVRHYSYPEGMGNCYSPRVIETLQRHGIVCTPSAIDGVNRVGDDLFHLKRIMVT